MPAITIDLMKEEDIGNVHAIELASFTLPWSLNQFQNELKNTCARYLILKEDGIPVAYAGVWFVIDEGHITNIAVRPDRRGLGYGEQVTRALIQLSADSGITYLTLECRRSNITAQSLYRKVGFQDVGYRKRYYTDTNEDALIMILEPLPEGDPERDPMLIRQ